jgi:5-methylcytosine-specific restriction endonuclease McrA
MGRRIQECYYCNLDKPTHGWGLCGSCYKGLRTNPDYIPKHKRPEKKCKICGSKYWAKDLCVKHYNQTPEAKARTKRSKAKPENKAKSRIRFMEWYYKNRDRQLIKMRERQENLTPEQIEKERLRNKQRTANGEFKNENKTPEAIEKDKFYGAIWRKNNPTYQSDWAKNNPVSIYKSAKKYTEKHSSFYTKMDLKAWGGVIKHIWNNCIICGSTEKLEAHHVKPRAQFPELALEIDNGITLCKKCHNEITQLLKKYYA